MSDYDEEFFSKVPSEYHKRVKFLGDKISKLEKQNEILKECVEFYANKDNWKDNDLLGYPPSIGNDSESGGYGTTMPEESDHLTVGGKRAREALIKLKDLE